ncbi:hypothetical protein POTOM_007232 [Populus tomentosa]|uniref:Uncharacterized protein n=1 Tax=Populus tomentosa TaxID=118781 RepID=A0A8X8DD68_POPTO|nr:hypothetical protein POTOM_007232 [Populus tomentosa]
MKFLMLKLEVSPMWLLNMTHPEVMLSVSLKSCIVAEQSVIKCSQIIEKMENQLSMFNYCREERALRKAEMEATKVLAENMIPHKDEIFSSPKRTWLVTEREKMLAAKQSSVEKEKGSGNEVMSAQQAEDLKMKEKRKREREDSIWHIVCPCILCFSAEAVKKALDAGKIVQKKAGKKSKPPPERTQSRTEEMRELFQSDMSERKQERSTGTRNRSPRIHLRANQGISGGSPIKFAIKLGGHLPR